MWISCSKRSKSSRDKAKKSKASKSIKEKLVKLKAKLVAENFEETKLRIIEIILDFDADLSGAEPIDIATDFSPQYLTGENSGGTAGKSHQELERIFGLSLSE